MRTLTFRQRRLLRKVDHQLRASAEAGAESADGELNIVPFLDVVVNLIMFLLMTVTATLALAQVPSEVPETRGDGVVPRAPAPAVPPLVHLGQDGVHVFAHGRRLAAGCGAPGEGAVTVPRVGGQHDWLGLRSCATALQGTLAAGRRVDLSATADMPYDDVIHAMDALRGPASAPLFPDVRWIAPGTAR